jgi:hypothetical protein
MKIKRTLTMCDNPNCGVSGNPESLRPYMLPYGWYTVSVMSQGCGKWRVEVCSLECIEPAVQTIMDKEMENDQ